MRKISTSFSLVVWLVVTVITLVMNFISVNQLSIFLLLGCVVALTFPLSAVVYGFTMPIINSFLVHQFHPTTLVASVVLGIALCLFIALYRAMQARLTTVGQWIVFLLGVGVIGFVTFSLNVLFVGVVSHASMAQLLSSYQHSLWQISMQTLLFIFELGVFFIVINWLDKRKKDK